MKKMWRETALLFLVLLPLAQLLVVWPAIPETIPVHYGITGEPDAYDSKQFLTWFLPLILLLTYGLLALVPIIDPRKKLHGGFFAIRVILQVFLAVVLGSYLHSLTGNWNFTRILPLALMAFLVVFGNYLPIIKPNYFVGVRTPWTLENEEVWKTTHRFSGRLAMAIGLAGLLLHLLWSTAPVAISLGIPIVWAIASLVYSYVAYQNLKPKAGN